MTGIVKQIDKSGRLNIPKETLKAVGIDNGDMVSISTGEDYEGLPSLVITKHEPGCSLCGNPVFHGEFVELNGARICKDCAKKIVWRREKLGF